MQGRHDRRLRRRVGQRALASISRASAPPTAAIRDEPGAATLRLGEAKRFVCRLVLLTPSSLPTRIPHNTTQVEEISAAISHEKAKEVGRRFGLVHSRPLCRPPIAHPRPPFLLLPSLSSSTTTNHSPTPRTPLTSSATTTPTPTSAASTTTKRFVSF